MTQELSRLVPSFNNDRMASYIAFRSPTPASNTVNSASQPHRAVVDNGQTAVAIQERNTTMPTRLDDAQAELAMEDVQQNAQDVLTAHNNIDPDRVARLLSLLE